MNGQVTRHEGAPGGERAAGNEQPSGAGLALAWSGSRGGSRRAAAMAIAALLALAAAVIVPAAQPAHGGSTSATPFLIGEHSALGPRLVSDRNEAIASMQQIRGEHAGITLADYQAESALIRDHIAHAPDAAGHASH